jgi:hypothetical protein
MMILSDGIAGFVVVFVALYFKQHNVSEYPFASSGEGKETRGH